VHNPPRRLARGEVEVQAHVARNGGEVAVKKGALNSFRQTRTSRDGRMSAAGCTCGWLSG